MTKQEAPFLIIGALTAFLLAAGLCAQENKNAALPNLPVTDVDGNIYRTVTIGAQIWMAEDLKTTRYRNGDAIGTTSPATLDIAGEDVPKYQWAYAGDERNVAAYGRLYTWNAATDSRNVCPVGWHVPSDAEWKTLIAFLGGERVAQGKLKETGTTHWNAPNSDATNESGFTALPGGNRFNNEPFLGLGDFTHWWTATEYDAKLAWRRTLWKDAPVDNTGGYSHKNIGWLVRCAKDAATLPSASIALQGHRTTAPSGAGEIHDAAAAGDLNKVKVLLEADPTLLESKDGSGDTPLISACIRPKAAVANYLIDKGANIHARDNNGATPLYYAAAGSFDLTHRLIDMKADVNVRAFVDSSYTPLHEAASSGDLTVAKLLIDHGADLNFRGSVGTVLQRTIYNKKESATEMAKLLLESGAKLQEFSFGNTELHLAVLRGYPEIIPLLVKHGANVNATNQYGHTPLYYAARHGYRKAAEALIAAGANQSAIVETNYGKARQLSQRLKDGEAYLWFLGGGSPGTGYAVKTRDHLLLFNPLAIDDSPEGGLANGSINPAELAGQKVTVLITQAVDRPVVAELARRLPDATFVLSTKPAADGAGNGGFPRYRIPGPHESFSTGGIRVSTIPAARQVGFLGAGVGYLVEADGVKIFHAGLHASNSEATQIETFRREIDFLKPSGPIDIAILPVNGRHLDIAYEPYLYLLDRLAPKAVYMDGDDLRTEEHRKCVEVLRARNIPVAYPEGGIAVGERFHYLRSRKGARSTASR